MQEWWKEHIVEVFVGVFTLLSYFGVSATDLLGVASYANYVMPFVYLGIGAFIGWRIHRYRSNRGAMAASAQSIGSEKQKERQSKEEIIEVFSQVPFEIKVFLKASLTHGSVYRDCHDHNWDAYSEWLSQFMTITSIRNDIFRCCVRDNVKSMFDEIPELLADVQEEDMRLYAVRGDEGVKPQVFSSSHLVWWYYTDDEDMPAPINSIGFMRQVPWD